MELSSSNAASAVHRALLGGAEVNNIDSNPQCMESAWCVVKRFTQSADVMNTNEY